MYSIYDLVYTTQSDKKSHTLEGLNKPNSWQVSQSHAVNNALDCFSVTTHICVYFAGSAVM